LQLPLGKAQKKLFLMPVPLKEKGGGGVKRLANEKEITFFHLFSCC